MDDAGGTDQVPIGEPRLPATLGGEVDGDDPQFPDLDGIDVREVEVAFPDARIVSILRSRLTGIRLVVGDASLVAQDAVLADLDLSGRRIDGLRRVRLERCRLTGADLSEARLTDVVFDDCALDLVSLRAARLERVEVSGGRLDGTDLAGATVTDARIAGVALVDLGLEGIRIEHLDLQGAVVGAVEDLAALRGATISAAQAVELAPRLARAAGLSVATP